MKRSNRLKPRIRNWLRIVLLGCLGALPGGCGHRENNADPHTEEKTAVGMSFNAKHGLYVPAATAKFIGLQVADVEERKVSSAFQFSAHVYRAASEAKYVSTQPGAAATALASASLSSGEAASLRGGQPVTVSGAGIGELPGKVRGVNRDLEKTTGHVEVILSITDEQARLARGAFLSVTVALGGEKSVASVPGSALLRTVEGDFVYTISGEHFVRTPVKLGTRNDAFAEVTDGLLEGDKVVVNPVMTLWLAELQSIRGGKACADGH